MDYNGAKNYILERIKKELPGNLHYHDLEHTLDVLTTVEMYAIAERVSDEDLKLLQTAAVFHDCGFIYQYGGHEIVGSKIAEEVLPLYSYNHKQVVSVSNMVYATALDVQPQNLLEEILCDADLDYLGREDFPLKGQKLKIEFYEQGIIHDEHNWEGLQLKFLKSHDFFTSTGRRLRQPLKDKYIADLEQLFAKY